MRGYESALALPYLLGISRSELPPIGSLSNDSSDLELFRDVAKILEAVLRT